MNFSIEKKGYNISEVNAFIEDMMAKYQRLQAQNSELEQKLATAKRLIRRFSDTENALKQNIADSKRAAAYMISDARDKSEVLLDSARESCGEIISDLDMQIAERMDTIDNMKASVAAFKDELFNLYSSHIELIDKLAYVAESFEYQPDYSPVADAVDKFEEEAEVPEIEVEFVEYPEESIFSEIIEKEETVEVEKADEVTVETVEETEISDDEDGDADELDQLVLDQAEFDAAEEIDFDTLELGDEETEVSEEVEEPDYFKFLADFANSEDGADL